MQFSTTIISKFTKNQFKQINHSKEWFFLFLEIAELLCYIRDRTPIKHLINPSYSFKQHLHFRATPFLIYFNLSILAFSFNVIYTFRNVALVDKLSHCEIFLTLLDTTLRITPSPTIQSLEYTIVIFQLTGKTCLDLSKKEKSLNTNDLREFVIEGYLFLSIQLKKSDNQIRFSGRID